MANEAAFKLVVNERFYITRDPYNWTLTEIRDGESRDGQPIKTERNTYYAKLSHALQVAIDRTAGYTDGSPAAILAAYQQTVAEIQAAVLMLSFT
jgi:hypothetical protein